MQRRDLLRWTGLGALAVPLGCAARDSQGPGAHEAQLAQEEREHAARSASGAPRKLKKAVKIYMVEPGATLLEKFQLLVECGFDGAELDSPGPYGTEEVLEARGKTGLVVPGVVDSVHWSKPLSSPDAAQRAEGRAALELALRECKACGGTSVLLVPAVVNREVSYAQAWERSTREIRALLPLARELGVQIAIENVWNQFLLSPLEAARYIDQFESPWIGWHLDVGNLVNYGWPEQWVRILGKRILKLDIKEYSRQKRDDEGLWKGFDVKLLEGDCDWPRVMAALDQIGYSGWGAAEIPGGGRDWLLDVSARMSRIYAS